MSPVAADYLSDDDLKRALSGMTLKAKTAKDGDTWQIRFGSSGKADFTFANGRRGLAQWRVLGHRIEFVFGQTSEHTCRMIFLAPDGFQHWQECDTGKTSSYITEPIFAIARQAVPSTPDVDDVVHRLDVESQALKAKQYEKLQHQKTQTITAGSALRYSMEFEAGGTYAVVAACGGACSRVSLVIRNPKGAVLAESPEPNSVVIVSGVVEQSGLHEVQVSAPGCQSANCAVGLQALRLAN